LFQLASGVYYVPGKNKSRFPYCSGLYIKGKKMRVLIDAGMGADQMAAVKQMGLDLLLLTHCHIDHRLFWYQIKEIPVWSHELEARLMMAPLAYFTQTGLTRSGVDITNLLNYSKKIFPVHVSGYLTDNQEIDVGDMRLIALHTPGHTPGHFSFFIPEYGILFSADIMLTRFGPFYGHDFSDIDDFIHSIKRLQCIEAKKIVTGHAGPFEKDLNKRFDKYAKVIDKREQKILELMEHPCSMEYLQKQNIIYPSYANRDDLDHWFELVHIEKHLKRLEKAGKVCCEGTCWRRL
jgi:glyoxylase-like metal-dependent hydrolase (beta-lactamase superfamily II)